MDEIEVSNFSKSERKEKVIYLMRWPPMSKLSEYVRNWKPSGLFRSVEAEALAINGVKISSITCNTCAGTKKKKRRRKCLFSMINVFTCIFYMIRKCQSLDIKWKNPRHKNTILWISMTLNCDGKQWLR